MAMGKKTNPDVFFRQDLTNPLFKSGLYYMNQAERAI